MQAVAKKESEKKASAKHVREAKEVGTVAQVNDARHVFTVHHM
jgi:hypothetical protein